MCVHAYGHIMLLSVRVIATRPFRRSAMIQDLPVPCLPPAKCSHPYRGRRGWTRDMSERTTGTSAGHAAFLPCPPSTRHERPFKERDKGG